MIHTFKTAFTQEVYSAHICDEFSGFWTISPRRGPREIVYLRKPYSHQNYADPEYCIQTTPRCSHIQDRLNSGRAIAPAATLDCRIKFKTQQLLQMLQKSPTLSWASSSPQDRTTASMLYLHWQDLHWQDLHW